MDIRVFLILLASLIQCNLGAPVQIFHPKLEAKATVNITDPTKDIFSMILEANKDSTKMLQHGDIAGQVGRSAMVCSGGGDSCRWSKNSNGIVNVPYTISTSYDAYSVSVITDAMKDFATLTCVRFIPRTVEPDYVQITSGSGCWSYVGKIGGPQVVSLQSGSCIQRGVVQHELDHVLGFYHEQSRSDRDDYVNIMTANIIPNNLANFDKMVTDNLGLEYDYSSVMHYGRYDFSIGAGLPTIVPKPDPTVNIGQRYGLSNLDISKINKLYNCGACSTVFPNSNGTLMSANYPSNYPTNADCVWLIRAPSNQIFLQFSAFDVQTSPDCASDYLRVYDGPTRSSPVLVDRACGTGQLPSLVSSTNMMLLEFVTDNATAATGFKATYSTVQCGTTFTSPSPGYFTPLYSTSSLNCTWVITAPTGSKVSIFMYQFDMGTQSTCSNAYLKVFDGPLTTSPQIGKYCAYDIVPSIISSGNSLLVQFYKDGSVPSATFVAGYQFDAYSVSVITDAMKDFATLTCVRFIPRTVEPDYVQITSSSGCWSYVGKIGGPQVVSLQSGSFIQRGVVQHELDHVLGFYHEQSRSDRDDYVNIMTANIIPSNLENFDKMVTDNLGMEYDYSSVMHYGRYDFSIGAGLPTIIPKPDPTVNIGQRYGLSNLDISKINKLYNCGACSTVLPNSNGTLMSANYPSNYPTNADCVWLIRAPSNQIFLQFSAFDVQTSPDCASDYLRVYDGPTRSSPVLVDRACGTGQLPSLVSSTNMMLLEFVTDNATAATGFKASYSTVQCGTTITSPSPGYFTPLYSTSSLNCAWVITAPKGSKVSIFMYQFDMGPQSTCSNAYLQFFDGPLTTSPQIGKYCAYDIVPSIISSGNSILVQFYKDGSVPSATFVAGYQFEFAGKLTAWELIGVSKDRHPRPPTAATNG
ncbi:embryonic protein UVS.2-like [Discoglossus pictus]